MGPGGTSLVEGFIKSPRPLMKKQAVKRHHHKHNLKHRYEFLETLGKGTYGKVKKARERSGKLVRAGPAFLRCYFGSGTDSGSVPPVQPGPQRCYGTSDAGRARP